MSANIAKIAKVTRIFHASWKHPWQISQISQKYKMWQNSRLRKKRKPRRAPKCPQISQKYQMQQNSRLTKKRSQEGPWNVCKNHKSNKDLSCCLKHPWQISQKYKMWQNSRLSRPEMSPNIAKIAKVTRIFLAMWKDWATNMAKIARITNLTKYFA